MKKIKVILLFLTILMSLIILFTACDDSDTSKSTTNCKHNYKSKVTTEATCTKDGVKTFTCYVCNDSYTEAIVATGNHNYTSKVTTEATCTKDGVKTFTCSECKDSYTETIAATGHTEITDKAVEATCTQAGKTEGKHCSTCNTIIVAQTTVKAKGHTEVIDKAIAATCTVGGKTQGKHCSVCNEILIKQTTTLAKGHKYSYSYERGEIKCSNCDNNKEIGSLGDDIFCAYGMVSTINRTPQIITFLGEKYVKVFGYIDYRTTSDWRNIDLYDSKGNTSSTTVFTYGESEINILISCVISADVDSNPYDNNDEYDGYIYIPYTGAGKYAITIDTPNSVYVIEFYVS